MTKMFRKLFNYSDFHRKLKAVFVFETVIQRTNDWSNLKLKVAICRHNLPALCVQSVYDKLNSVFTRIKFQETKAPT